MRGGDRRKPSGGEQVENDRGVDKVDFFPYCVGDTVGARCRGGRGFGEGELHFFFGEGGSGGVFRQASPAR